MGRWARGLLLCGLVAMVGACESAPHEAVDDFLVVALKGDKAAACRAFSLGSRRLMQDMAASGFTGGRDACDHLFTIFKPRGVESLTTRYKEGDEDGNKAEVSIVDFEGKHSSMWLVKEDGRWKIDLLHQDSSSSG